MTEKEFSDEFDILLNSYAHETSFGEGASQLDINLNEYEKSVFLSKAQEDIVKELYSGTYTGNSFESSERARRELESLVDLIEYPDDICNHAEYFPNTVPSLDESNDDSSLYEYTPKVLFDGRLIHTVYQLPINLLYIIYEQASWKSENKCLNSALVDVCPVTHDEYLRIRENPFRGPNTRKVLRLDKGDNEVELVSVNVIDKYVIRYIKKPEPIVLVDLTNESIDNVNISLTCKLNTSLHRDILDRAVRLALASRITNLKNNSNSESTH